MSVTYDWVTLTYSAPDNAIRGGIQQSFSPLVFSDAIVAAGSIDESADCQQCGFNFTLPDATLTYGGNLFLAFPTHSARHVTATFNSDETLSGSVSWGDGDDGFRASGAGRDWTAFITGNGLAGAIIETGYWIHPLPVPEPTSLAIAAMLLFVVISLKCGFAARSCRGYP